VENHKCQVQILALFSRVARRITVIVIEDAMMTKDENSMRLEGINARPPPALMEDADLDAKARRGFARVLSGQGCRRRIVHEVVEVEMARMIENLSLADAKYMLEAAERKASDFGIAYSVAVVDAGGHPLAFSRQDGALIGSIELAINKATTARIFDTATQALAALAQPSAPLYGIQHGNHGNVVVFGGGIPVVRNDTVIGAVGASAGTVEQDIAVAEAAVAAVPATSPRE
jgi:uncharacterized protein GlcG (DUF336 family)